WLSWAGLRQVCRPTSAPSWDQNGDLLPSDQPALRAVWLPELPSRLDSGKTGKRVDRPAATRTAALIRFVAITFLLAGSSARDARAWTRTQTSRSSVFFRRSKPQTDFAF